MTVKKVAVIGCGNMASAVVRSLDKSDIADEQFEFYTYTPSKTKAVKLAQEVNGSVLESLKDIEKCDYIMIACKPQQFNDLANNLEGIDLSSKVIISIMAGISLAQISSTLSTSKIIRLMPSIPMESGEGICLLKFSSKVSREDSEFLKNALKDSSSVFIIEDEKLFDRVTVISASGPAYIYYFMSAMEKSLVSWGMKEEDCRPLVAQLFRGSAKNALDKSSFDLELLIDKVTSKKGVTIEAIDSFREDEVEKSIQLGLFKAVQRSEQIRESMEGN